MSVRSLLIATLLLTILVLASTILVLMWSEGVAFLEPSQQSSATFFRWLAVGSAAALTVGGGFAVLLSRSVAAPVRGLTEALRRMVAGDFTVRTSLDRESELSHLSQAINDVANQMEFTLREQRRESIRLRTLLNGMQDGVCLTDGGGQIELSNRAFDLLFETEARGRPIVDVIRLQGIRRCVWAALGGTDSMETVEMVGQGQPRSLLVQANALAEEGGAVIMIHDVTPLRRADRIRRDFVANASHELRTPLTAIRGFAETLRDGAIDDPKQARRFVEVIIRNAIRLQVVADDLVHLSKAEAPTQDFELGPVEMQPLISDLRATFTEQAKQRGLVFVAELEGEPVALSNNVALDHILTNLISNAFKASSTNSVIAVKCFESGGQIHVEVTDSGPGISEKHLERIFERFYRIDRGRANDAGGTGLGLAIVKHLAERIDAQIVVQSEVGEGSTFSIRLPPFTLFGDEA